MSSDFTCSYCSHCAACGRSHEEETARLKGRVALADALVEAEKCGATILFDENHRLKGRVALLENVREAAQETYQVLCIEYGYRKAEVNFVYLSKALENCEATDDKQD